VQDKILTFARSLHDSDHTARSALFFTQLTFIVVLFAIREAAHWLGLVMLTSLRAGAERKTIITQCTHFTEATLLSLAHSFGKKNVSTVWIDSVETLGGGATPTNLG